MQQNTASQDWFSEGDAIFAENLHHKVPTELLDFKFRLMKWKGYKLMEPPISAKSNFLRDLPIPKEGEYL